MGFRLFVLLLIASVVHVAKVVIIAAVPITTRAIAASTPLLVVHVDALTLLLVCDLVLYCNCRCPQWQVDRGVF